MESTRRDQRDQGGSSSVVTARRDAGGGGGGIASDDANGAQPSGSPPGVTGETWQHEVPRNPNCKCVFPWLLTEGIVHLLIYLYKLVEDSRSVVEYWEKRQSWGLLTSIVCLAAPTLIYAIYETLQTALSNDSSVRDVLTKLVKGTLLIPWQIKGHCEMLAFSAEKACQFRRLEDKEIVELARIKQETFVLEFFADFYSGFMQLLLQLHFVLMMMSTGSTGFVIYTEIIGSSLAILSLIKALQRRDDGCLTKTLSFLGWTSFCVSRVLAFALLSSIVGGAVVAVVLLHAAVMTFFITKIITNAYRAERQQAALEGRASNVHIRNCNSILVVLAFFLFGVPSVIYWPMMFQFKKKLYIFSFLLLSVAENVLFALIWFLCKGDSKDHRFGQMFTAAILISSLLAVGFLSLYVLFKPSISDLVVLSHIRETKTNKYGIFFDFCKAVHILPNVEDIDRIRDHLTRLRPELVGRTARS